MAKQKETGPPKGRRYISTKETVAYILYDYAGGLALGDMGDQFKTRVLNLDLSANAFISTFIVGPWDVVNDLIFATLVDKTRTRYGKFRPYLIVSLFTGLPFQLFYYLMPLMFWNTPATYLPKLIAYGAFSVLSETVGTFNSIASGGMLATLTPNMYERSRLITLTSFVNNYTGKRVPGWIMSLFITIYDNSGMERSAVLLKLRTMFLIFGVATAVVSACMAIYFAIVGRERIPQTEKQPGLKESFKALLDNRLLLVMAMSQLFETFSIGGDGEYSYYNAVLKFPLGSLVAGIPGALSGNLIWPFIPKLRERFSTRTLWLVSTHFRATIGIAIYFVGLIGDSFRYIWLALPILAIWELIYSPMMPLRNVVQRDMLNECMDYGEWKTGQRNEAMIGVVMRIASKISNYIFSGLNTKLRAAMGFRTGVDYTNQPLKVQRFVWGLFTFYPAITGNILSMIPKIFYNLSKEDRERMYEELAERRALMITEQSKSAETAEMAESALAAQEAK